MIGRFMLKACVFFCALTLSVPVQASDWRMVNWNDDMMLYVDLDTISHARGTVTYAAKIVFLKDESLAELQSRVQMKCADRLYRNLSNAALSRAGRAHIEKATGAWRPIAAGSNVEREAQNVCN